MRVIIITEGYQSTGYGHITRCLSLFQAFQSRGITPLMIVNGDEPARHFLEGSEYLLLNWLDNTGELLGKIDANSLVIVDSYKAGEEFYTALKSSCALLAVIDDYMRLDYDAHIIINGTIGSEKYPYKREGRVKYLLGSSYIPLRSEFLNVKERCTKENISSVLITMGGQDIRDLTAPVIKLLLEKYPGLIITAIVKKEFNIDFEYFAGFPNLKFVFDADAKKMKELMEEADIAVTAAGQTLYELARTGTPPVAVIVADNQIKNLKGWIESGFIKDEIHYDDSDYPEKIIAGIEKLQACEVRIQAAKTGMAAVDGKGAELAAAEILIAFCGENDFYLRPAVSDDAKNIYDLSSDPVVRENSIITKPIEWNEHMKWFNKKLLDKNHFFLLAFSKEGEFIGQVRFGAEEKSAVVSISIASSFRGKNLSSRILINASELFFSHFTGVEKIKAYIKPDNTSSIKSFLKAGYAFHSSEMINNEDFNLYLKLK